MRRRGRSWYERRVEISRSHHDRERTQSHKLDGCRSVSGGEKLDMHGSVPPLRSSPPCRRVRTWRTPLDRAGWQQRVFLWHGRCDVHSVCSAGRPPAADRRALPPVNWAALPSPCNTVSQPGVRPASRADTVSARGDADGGALAGSRPPLPAPLGQRAWGSGPVRVPVPNQGPILAPFGWPPSPFPPPAVPPLACPALSNLEAVVHGRGGLQHKVKQGRLAAEPPHAVHGGLLQHTHPASAGPALPDQPPPALPGAALN